MRTHAVVLMTSRRVENERLAILTFCDVISGDILDRSDGRILNFFNFFQVYEAYKMAACSGEQGLQVSHELQLQIVNVLTSSQIFSRLALPLSQ